MRTELAAFDSRATVRMYYTIAIDVEAGKRITVIADGVPPTHLSDSQGNVWTCADGEWHATTRAGGTLLLSAVFGTRVGTVVHIYLDESPATEVANIEGASTDPPDAIVEEHASIGGVTTVLADTHQEGE